MAKYSIEDTTLTGIGDAIRAKEGSSGTIPVTQIASRISAIETGKDVSSVTATADDGTTAYEFLSVSPSSRVYGLGGHNLTIIDDDINLVEQNPALLGPEFSRQVGVSYMRYLGNSNFMSASFGNGVNERSAWGVRVQYFGYGKMTEADAAGMVTGTFSPNSRMSRAFSRAVLRSP